MRVALALVVLLIPEKSDFQSAAESFAKHFNDDYLKKLKKP